MIARDKGECLFEVGAEFIGGARFARIISGGKQGLGQQDAPFNFLWLSLQDAYWEKQGRQSIDAVVIFASLLSVGIWGGPFLRAASREILKLRRKPSRPG